MVSNALVGGTVLEESHYLNCCCPKTDRKLSSPKDSNGMLDKCSVDEFSDTVLFRSVWCSKTQCDSVMLAIGANTANGFTTNVELYRNQAYSSLLSQGVCPA